MDERVEGAEGDAVRVAALHPDVEEAGEELGERGLVEIEFGLDRLGRAAGEGGVDLEAREAEFLGEVAVKGVGAGVEAALVEHGDDADLEAGGLGFAEPLGPDRGVGLGAAFEEFAVEIREIHRRAERAAEHRAQHVIPRGRVADEIRLEVMREAASARGGGRVHELAGFHEPRRAHDHRLAALPVDFAFLDAFVLQVIEQLAGEQRDEQHRKAVRLLVLEAVVAGHVALRGGEQDDAEDAVAHGGGGGFVAGEIAADFVRGGFERGEELLHAGASIGGIGPFEIARADRLPAAGRALRARVDQAREMGLDEVRRRGSHGRGVAGENAAGSCSRNVHSVPSRHAAKRGEQRVEKLDRGLDHRIVQIEMRRLGQLGQRFGAGWPGSRRTGSCNDAASRSAFRKPGLAGIVTRTSRTMRTSTSR